MNIIQYTDRPKDNNYNIISIYMLNKPRTKFNILNDKRLEECKNINNMYKYYKGQI